MNKKHPSISERILENKKRLGRFLKVKNSLICIAIFITGNLISYYFLVGLEKPVLQNSIFIPIIITLVALIGSFTLKPPFIFGFAATASILVTSLFLMNK